MQQSVKNELLEYFKNLPGRTLEENRLLFYLQSSLQEFDIISVSRDDVHENGYDADGLTDTQMECLAENIALDYKGYGFKDDLSFALDLMGIKKLSDNQTTEK